MCVCVGGCCLEGILRVWMGGCCPECVREMVCLGRRNNRSESRDAAFFSARQSERRAPLFAITPTMTPLAYSSYHPIHPRTSPASPTHPPTHPRHPPTHQLGGYLTDAGDLHHGRLEALLTQLAELEMATLQERAEDTEWFENKKQKRGGRGGDGIGTGVSLSSGAGQVRGRRAVACGWFWACVGCVWSVFQRLFCCAGAEDLLAKARSHAVPLDLISDFTHPQPCAHQGPADRSFAVLQGALLDPLLGAALEDDDDEEIKPQVGGVGVWGLGLGFGSCSFETKSRGVWCQQ